MLDGMINGTYDDLKYIVMFIVVVMDICCGDDSAGGAAATPQLHVVLVVVLGFRFHLFFSSTTLFCLVMRGNFLERV